jgi:hypothetical protein
MLCATFFAVLIVVILGVVMPSAMAPKCRLPFFPVLNQKNPLHQNLKINQLPWTKNGISKKYFKLQNILQAGQSTLSLHVAASQMKRNILKMVLAYQKSSYFVIRPISLDLFRFELFLSSQFS